MLMEFIRFYTITFNSLLSFKKIMNIEKKTYELILFICLSIPMAFSLVLTHSYVNELEYIFLLISSSIILKLIYMQELSLTIISTIFSIVLNLCCFALSVICQIPLYIIIGFLTDFKYPNLLVLLLGLFLFITHTLFLHLLFKHKRFKKGFPYIKLADTNYIIFFIFLCAIIIYSLMTVATPYSVLFILLTTLLLISLLFYLYWKDQLKKKFTASLLNRQFIAIENQLNSIEAENNLLKSQNETLGSIVHKDNKIVTAMTLAVEQLLIKHPDDTDSMSHLEKLKLLQEERNGYLCKQDQNTSFVCNTGSIRIDSIVNYMNQKAKEKNVKMHFIEDISLEDLTPDNENDICTLIADTTENAIIATAFAQKTDIKLDVKISKKIICLKIYDCGLPFDKKVIKVMGRRRYTTHKDTGGSGIGMMTTFEIIRKYQASYAINETIDDSNYSKCITITFDKLHNITYNGKMVR